MTGRLAALVALAASSLTACGEIPSTETAHLSACRVVQPPTRLAPEIEESSGAVVSRRQPGVIWTHNDSGGQAELFAVDATGQVIGRVMVRNAENIDWEDLALAPCAAGDCLYIADTGDNDGLRSEVQIYRITEPAARGSTETTAERFPVRYPEGPRDAEGLFVLPGERVFVVTRGRHGAIQLYRYPGPLRPDATVELELVRSLSGGPVPTDDQVTAADATRDGRWIALRTPTALLLYPSEQLVDGVPGQPIRANLTPLVEAQGEAIGLGENGAVVLTSEGGETGLAGTISVLWCPVLAGTAAAG